MNIRIGFLLAIALFSSSCMVAPTIVSSDGTINGADATSLDTDAVVAKYLTGRPLDLVEGAWVHEGNAYEIVIVRNEFNIEPDYDYLGIITYADSGSWKQGDVKLLMREVGSDTHFEGVWLMQDKSRRKMSFNIENRNLIQANFVSPNGNTFFIRTYRKYAHNQ